MNDLIQKLEPRVVWENFVDISLIPRRSNEEGRAREFVQSKARDLGLESTADSAGNLLVRKKGRGGGREKPVAILQSHLDMVCVAEKGTSHDFGKDPLRLRSDGKYVMASGTSLGADNGMGVAAMLALMQDDSLETGPLDFLFTVDEETGLTGALDLDPGLLRGRRLLNFDTSEEGTLIIGCSGGMNVVSTFPFTKIAMPAESGHFSIGIGGLTGGHSGLDIHRHRANAIKLLAGLLLEVGRVMRFPICGFEGGDKSNVIPREASAVILAPKGKEEWLERTALDYIAGKRKEYGPDEPNLQLEIKEAMDFQSKGHVMDAGSVARLAEFLQEVPHGTAAMSRIFPDVVETSSNLATARWGDGTVTVGMNCRSPVDASMDALAASIKKLADRFGMYTALGSRYPGWLPDLDSPLLKKARAAYKEKFGKEPKVRAVHAGLECGVIGSKAPGMDIISFGPTIKDLHSPRERVEISSVDRFWGLVKEMVEF
ncbi:MAG: beta-Ala-His dipeptidase [Nitrospinae bacterium]|nr:beta-Ala-His dipeptidase [Nitrospinota bacterium]